MKASTQALAVTVAHVEAGAKARTNVARRVASAEIHVPTAVATSSCGSTRRVLMRWSCASYTSNRSELPSSGSAAKACATSPCERKPSTVAGDSARLNRSLRVARYWRLVSRSAAAGVGSAPGWQSNTGGSGSAGSGVPGTTTGLVGAVDSTFGLGAEALVPPRMSPEQAVRPQTTSAPGRSRIERWETRAPQHGSTPATP